ARIIEQLIDNIPEGEVLAKVPKVLKLPVGHWFQLVEGCRGVFGVYIESDGGTSPVRMKFVTPSLNAAAVVDSITTGNKIADLITIAGSLDYIVPDMDR
ncbi:MAG: NADH-quinone oxidoreductase subunit C, partial [Muribaculaceae bacterium]|nr:NADH-quinone oxidoreductase subunit C [Muribaculaceae bacterium]